MELETLFNGIVDAIHEKDGKTDGIAAEDFPARIRAIPSGGLDGVMLESIEITAPPAKTAYAAGQPFDPLGMAVYASFSNGQSMYVNHSNLTFSPGGPLEEDTAAVTVSFQWGMKLASAVQPVCVSAANVFGVCWSRGEPSSALTRLTPDTDPNGLVTEAVESEPVPAVGGGSGSSPFDGFQPWAGMEEYNISAGGMARKRGGEGFSREELDTMVYIPEFYYAVVDDPENSRRYWYVSNAAVGRMKRHPGSGRYLGRYASGAGYVSKSGRLPLTSVTRAQARAGSRGKGAGWRQYDFMSHCAVCLLYLVEFADWDSQEKIGKGYVDLNADTDAAPSGGTDSMTYHTGRAEGADGQTFVQYRHLENLWGNVFQWVDGFNALDFAAYLTADPARYGDSVTEYDVPAGVIIPGEKKGIKAFGMSAAAPWALIPSEVTDDQNAYVQDYVFSKEGICALTVGGQTSGWPDAEADGLFCFDASNAPDAAQYYIGCRLLFDPEATSVEGG